MRDSGKSAQAHGINHRRGEKRDEQAAQRGRNHKRHPIKSSLFAQTAVEEKECNCIKRKVVNGDVDE